LQKKVQRLTELLPHEEEEGLGLNHGQLIAVNNGTDLLLYGGYHGDYVSDIWLV
jgi:hypothetical protein